jgi:hypothetical protein
VEGKVTAPIVISLGRVRDKDVREFRQGAGPIIEEVGEVMRLVSGRVDLSERKRVLVPIVVIYSETP